MNAEQQLGIDSKLIQLEQKSDVLAMVLALTQQASKSLFIASRELDQFIFDNSAFASALTQFARKHPSSVAKILIQRTEKCVSQGHRIVTLSQKLSSHIRIRKYGEKHKNYNEAFVVADGVGYLHLPLADRCDGKACYSDSKKSQHLSEFFTETWDQSELIADFKRLSI